jgi:hypothetical protein
MNINKSYNKLSWYELLIIPSKTYKLIRCKFYSSDKSLCVVPVSTIEQLNPPLHKLLYTFKYNINVY